LLRRSAPPRAEGLDGRHHQLLKGEAGPIGDASDCSCSDVGGIYDPVERHGDGEAKNGTKALAAGVFSRSVSLKVKV
jgi:hypothetical protein